jgi:hypothetical protein
MYVHLKLLQVPETRKHTGSINSRAIVCTLLQIPRHRPAKSSSHAHKHLFNPFMMLRMRRMGLTCQRGQTAVLPAKVSQQHRPTACIRTIAAASKVGRSCCESSRLHMLGC